MAVLAQDNHRQTILLFKWFIALLMAQEGEGEEELPVPVARVAPEEEEEEE
jgi:hypothetical protein